MATLYLTFEHPLAYLWGCTYSPHGTHTFFQPSMSESHNTPIGITIPTHNHVLKITAYRRCETKQGPRFQTMGTCILQIRRNKKIETDTGALRERKVGLFYLQPPLQTGGKIETTVPWRQCPQVQSTTVTVTSCRLECIFDLMPMYKKIAMACIEATLPRILKLQDTPLALPCTNFRGFIRNSQFDFDMPFPMPGAWGIRAMLPTTFSIPMWIQLVYAACCLGGYDKTQFEQSTPMQKHNTLDALCIIALGSTWLSGYEYEKVDDTSTTWSSLGSFKDCEDFVITMVSLATTLLDSTSHFTPCALTTFFENTTHVVFQHMAPVVLALTQHLQETFKDPCMVCGWIQPKPQEYEGHAWGAIYNRRLQQQMFIECTGPILPHVYEDTIHQTPSNRVQLLYGGALQGPLSTLDVPGDTYGPAQFRPPMRYLCVATQYTATSGMYIGPPHSVKMVGVKASDFETMQYAAHSLMTKPELAPDLAQWANYSPDFTDSGLIHNITRTLETNGYATNTRLNTQLAPLIPRRNLQFAPSVFIASQCIPSDIQTTLEAQMLQIDIIHPLPYMTGILIFNL